MRFRVIILIFFILLVNGVMANNTVGLQLEGHKIIIEYQDESDEILRDSISPRVVKFKRGKAIAFTVLTGLFGGHRIYFGTHHRTPILYSITFGGLGILPVIDLVHIIFTKDLSRYEHKSQVIMWGK